MIVDCQIKKGPPLRIAPKIFIIVFLDCEQSINKGYNNHTSH
jgi:hypothetical protein